MSRHKEAGPPPSGPVDAALQTQLSRRLYGWHQMWLADVVGIIARDMQGSASSLLYNADYLAGLPAGERDAGREAQAEILSTSQDIANLLAKLTDLARVGEAAREAVPAADLLRSARRICQQRNPEVLVDMQGSAWEATFHTNSILAARILSELLLNAAAVCPGEVTTVRCEAQILDARHYAQISVIDQGPGVTDEDLPCLFEPFFTTREGCCGLGLTIGREAARMLGGDLSLAHPRSPTTFTLTLPRIPPDGGNQT